MGLKLYILRPVYREDGGIPKGGPWDPWYDKTFGAVIRADSEAKARQLMASDYRGAEGGPAWINPTLSTCELLTVDGAVGAVITDFRRA